MKRRTFLELAGKAGAAVVAVPLVLGCEPGSPDEDVAEPSSSDPAVDDTPPRTIAPDLGDEEVDGFSRNNAVVDYSSAGVPHVWRTGDYASSISIRRASDDSWQGKDPAAGNVDDPLVIRVDLAGGFPSTGTAEWFTDGGGRQTIARVFGSTVSDQIAGALTWLS